MTEDNYFDSNEEDALHDAFLMSHSERTDYDNLRDVLLGETIFEERGLDWWQENIDEV